MKLREGSQTALPNTSNKKGIITMFEPKLPNAIQKHQEMVRSHESHVCSLSGMNVTLSNVSWAWESRSAIYHAIRISDGMHIVWTDHHGDCLTNGFYTPDAWDAIEEFEKRVGTPKNLYVENE